MKTIAFVMPRLLPMPPVRGGAVETLVDSLIRENEQTGRYEITVFSTDDELARQAYPQFKHARFVPIRVPQWQNKVNWLVKGVLAKVFHIGCTPGAAYLLAVMRAMRGRRFDRIVVENQAPFVSPIARMGIGPVDLHMHNIAIASEQPRLERVAGRCRRILCVSDYIRDWMMAHTGAGPEKTRVLLNCVDAERFAAARSRRREMRARLGIDEHELVFLFTGRMLREKGALEAALAFARLGRPDARLVIVGSAWFADGGQMTDYQREVCEAVEPVRDRVVFTGLVRYQEMAAYYALADVAVMPSIWDEPGALTVLEAQAAGLPLITTRSGGIPQNTCPEGAVLLERGEGLVDRLTQSMRTLAEDDALRARMSQAALAWSRERSEESYYAAFCALLEEP